MSTKAIPNDATSKASTQASLAEFHDAFACEQLDEPASDEETCEVAQRDDTRDDLDYSQTVIVTENGSHYHAILHGQICACPHVHGTRVSLEEAIESENLPCGVCNPVDYRRERSETQPATVEDFS